jgi:hypothetical protein
MLRSFFQNPGAAWGAESKSKGKGQKAKAGRWIPPEPTNLSLPLEGACAEPGVRLY